MSEVTEPSQGPGSAPDDPVHALLLPHVDELRAFRRYLHANPELSGEETSTTELLRERLRVAGLQPSVLEGGTGLTCDLGDTGPDAVVVALRADIDALAMDDTKDVPYRSQRPGVAHACGHDVHTAVVLGAGILLHELGTALGPGRGVRLVFEPAEESVPGGAVDILAAGRLDGVRAIFGLHCDPKIDLGCVGVRVGPLTSAADVMEIELTGPGGHTARPELTVDLVAVAARVVLELPATVAAHARPHGDLRVVFGAAIAGTAPNVIPTSAVLRASVRTPDRDAWQVAADAVRHALHEVVDPTGAGWTLRHVRGVPPVVNEARATAILTDAARAVVGVDGVTPAPQSWGGDSFAWYLERIPGSYARLGVHDPASRQPRLDLHAGNFDVDERAIGIGIRVLVGTALRALASPAAGRLPGVDGAGPGAQ